MLSVTPAWLRWADSERGVKEVSGPDHHPQVLHYHSFTTLQATTDEVPWCASFICASLEEGADLPSTKSARARSFLNYGLHLGIPAYGCVCVIKRGGPNQPGPTVLDAQGHVGLLVDIEAEWIYLLGGNQTNEVSVSRYSIGRVLGYRWPN